MGTGNTIMSSNIVMLALLALFVVAGLAVSLIAIALATIRSVNGQVPQQPADVERKLKMKVPRQRTAPPEPPVSLEPSEPPDALDAPRPSRSSRAHAKLSRSGR